MISCYRYCEGSKKNTPKVKMLKDGIKLIITCMFVYFNDTLFFLMLKSAVLRFF